MKGEKNSNQEKGQEKRQRIALLEYSRFREQKNETEIIKITTRNYIYPAQLIFFFFFFFFNF